MSEYVIFTNKDDIVNIADIVREKADLDEEMTLGQIASAIDEYWETSPKPYLKFSSPETFSISVANRGWDATMEYSTDRKTWNTWDGDEISGTKIYLRGTNNTIVTGSTSAQPWTLTGSNISCKGNIENLLDYATVAAGNHPMMFSHCYRYMFQGCTSLITAPELPATELVSYCYSSMFQGCTSLITAPELPATTLATYCYNSMFKECTNLITAPELPATTLATYCYNSMFQDCTSLITAPELPATTLAGSCYFRMFYNCPSLTQAPELPATTLAGSCYYSMFHGCINLTTAPELPATTLAASCYYNMFYNCSALTEIPVLPAITLTNNCYTYMFRGCTKIKISVAQDSEYTQPYRIPMEGIGITASSALSYMFIYSGGTFTGTPTINTIYYLHKDCTIVPAS